MQRRRWIALFVLFAFLPAATGCSKTRSVSMADDPVNSDTAREINGYTDRSGTRHEWNGEVSTAGADSLEFFRLGGDPLAYGPRPEETMRLARTDVASLELRESNTTANTLIVLGVVVAVIGGIVVAAGLHSMSKGFSSN